MSCGLWKIQKASKSYYNARFWNWGQRKGKNQHHLIIYKSCFYSSSTMFAYMFLWLCPGVLYLGYFVVFTIKVGLQSRSNDLTHPREISPLGEKGIWSQDSRDTEKRILGTVLRYIVYTSKVTSSIPGSLCTKASYLSVIDIHGHEATFTKIIVKYFH